MSTHGPDYVESIDGHRIQKQHVVIRNLMLDGIWRTLSGIATATGYPEASVSAQLRHLRKAQFGGYIVNKKRVDINGGSWEYRVEEREPVAKEEVQLNLFFGKNV